MINNLPDNAGDVRDAGSIPGWRRSAGGGNSNPLPVFLLGKSHGHRSPLGSKELVMTE